MAGTESKSYRRKEAAHQEGLYFTETAGVLLLLLVQSSEIRNTRNGQHTTGYIRTASYGLVGCLCLGFAVGGEAACMATLL